MTVSENTEHRGTGVEGSYQFLGFPTAIVGVEHKALLVKAFHQYHTQWGQAISWKKKLIYRWFQDHQGKLYKRNNTKDVHSCLYLWTWNNIIISYLFPLEEDTETILSANFSSYYSAFSVQTIQWKQNCFKWNTCLLHYQPLFEYYKVSLSLTVDWVQKND